MANLTVTIDEEVLRRARIRALQLGTSVNAVVRDYLASYAGESPAADASREFVRVAPDFDTSRTFSEAVLNESAGLPP